MESILIHNFIYNLACNETASILSAAAINKSYERYQAFRCFCTFLRVGSNTVIKTYLPHRSDKVLAGVLPCVNKKS